jgi:hypothetical protein
MARSGGCESGRGIPKSGLLPESVSPSIFKVALRACNVRATTSSKKALSHRFSRSPQRRRRHSDGSCDRLYRRNSLAARARHRVERDSQGIGSSDHLIVVSGRLGSHSQRNSESSEEERDIVSTMVTLAHAVKNRNVRVVRVTLRIHQSHPEEVFPLPDPRRSPSTLRTFQHILRSVLPRKRSPHFSPGPRRESVKRCNRSGRMEPSEARVRPEMACDWRSQQGPGENCGLAPRPASAFGGRHSRPSIG